MKISTLETKLASRYNEFDPEQDGNKNTKFSDIIIDGTSLYQRLKNMNWYLVSDGEAMNIKGFLLIIFYLRNHMNPCIIDIPF